MQSNLLLNSLSARAATAGRAWSHTVSPDVQLYIGAVCGNKNNGNASKGKKKNMQERERRKKERSEHTQ
jgi:hypothetical protein